MCLGTATLWTCRRSSCVSPTRVFCTSSCLRISRALLMCALVYRAWTTPLSVTAATRSCGQATRAQPGTYGATCSALEILSQLAMVLCQEHSLSASLCNVQHQRLIQSYSVDVCTDSADERSCVVSCASGYSIVGDPPVWPSLTNDSWIDGGLPTCEPQASVDLGLQLSRVGLRWDFLQPHVHSVLRFGLRCQRHG